MHLNELSEIAIEAALAAGKIILQHRTDDILVEHKATGNSRLSQVVTAVDRACETAILAHLSPTRAAFGIALLSEETEDDGSRFKHDFFWCIDPLDGTLAFINKHSGFSVSIALVATDGTPHIGVVFDPSTNVLYHAIKGQGVYKNGTRWTPKATNEHLTYVTDQELKDTPRADEISRLLQEKVAAMGLSGIQEIAGAGSVLNAMLVLKNGPACMFKFPKSTSGGGSIWDFAATACIFHELGLPATNFMGGKLDLNRQENTFMNHQGVFYANGFTQRR